ncbi:sigma-70 family RNA polymerase sigma factor [soil metagenome]
MQRAKRGEAGAFDQLYREHVERVYAICLRLSADPVLAESLTQDAFVRAWKGLDSFRGQSRLSTWLYRIAVNVTLEDRRSAARHGETFEAAVNDEHYVAVVRDAAPDTQIDLERAIRTLPRGARTMVVLHDIEGYRYEEIAEMTGAAVGTVKSQLHRGRKLLREALG